MKITSIEKDQGSGQWYGSANDGEKNYLWYYSPRLRFSVQEKDKINPRAWMNVDPPTGAKKAVLKAVRKARS